MKVLIVTIVDNINFGTYLQAFATAYKVKARSNEVEVLDYVRPYLTGRYFMKQYLNNKDMGFIKRAVYAFFYGLLNPFMIWQVKRFLTSRIKVTRKYTSLSQIKKNPPTADLYLTGSDQVWNSSYNRGIDRIFFLDFVEGRKSSYAASIGIEHFPEEEKKQISGMLKKYQTISVRESFGITALNNLGIEDVELVLDPTLLLTGEEWRNISYKSDFKKTEKYLLIYSVESERNSFVIDQAREIAVKKGLKLYLVCATFKFNSAYRVDRIFNFTSVETFLALFANADFVVVSSFHGTAFAINFNKQFFTVSPGKFSTRVNSLLKLLNIQERYIREKLIYNENIPDIDYENVNEVLQKERRKSEDYLDRVVG